MQDSLSFFRITYFDEVSSTNDLIKQSIDKGAPEGEVVCARVQAAGYGRQGRVWKSPEGGLYMSVLLRPAVEPAQLPTLSLVVGIAVRRAIAGLAELSSTNNVLVKWPNDIVLCMSADKNSGAFQKMCGISNEQHSGAICIGIGVNVQKPHSSNDVGGKNVAAYVSDIVRSNAPSIDLVCRTILQNFLNCYTEWIQTGFATFLEEYNANSALTGREVRVQRADGSLIAEGIVCGIDSTGALVVRDAEGAKRKVLSGEAHIAL
ncbi:biotin--[acetyl-CoA-carboxylase] ligase [Adlercreutzia sp. ZJ304]|uniref:biotin--[acetyl-CoA-carboxylase] ligase n=1 Tax=Adlercreutzia sp. ZJ304 TaxID=2709791 RepID=UPI0013ED4F4A|nr:biotin--[acetyl-CoA-carboxylase] ligase [Adlercreutzia sp. ZJ304]